MRHEIGKDFEIEIDECDKRVGIIDSDDDVVLIPTKVFEEMVGWWLSQQPKVEPNPKAARWWLVWKANSQGVLPYGFKPRADMLQNGDTLYEVALIRRWDAVPTGAVTLKEVPLS